MLISESAFTMNDKKVGYLKQIAYGLWFITPEGSKTNNKTDKNTQLNIRKNKIPTRTKKYTSALASQKLWPGQGAWVDPVKSFHSYSLVTMQHSTTVFHTVCADVGGPENSGALRPPGPLGYGLYLETHLSSYVLQC